MMQNHIENGDPRKGVPPKEPPPFSSTARNIPCTMAGKTVSVRQGGREVLP